MPAELERRLEAGAAKGTAGGADVGARFDEVVVHGAGAVGAADLAARPIGLLWVGAARCGAARSTAGRARLGAGGGSSAKAGPTIASAESTPTEDRSNFRMTPAP